jgi:hypothetical protein
MSTTKPKKGKGKRAQPPAVDTAAVANGEAAPATKARKAPKPPVNYTTALGQRICDLIAEGGSIPKICAMPGMPTERCLWNWERRHEDFAKAIEQARERRGNATFEKLAALEEDIKAGKVPPNEARVMFDLMKFRIQQDNRRRYSDRPVAVDVKVGVGVQAVDTS